MTIPRLRIRSFMILVLVVALFLAVYAAISKLNRNEINELKPWAVVLGAFVLMVLSKLALLIVMRARRFRSEHQIEGGSSATVGSETPPL